jgi:hypothetical protein
VGFAHQSSDAAIDANEHSLEIISEDQRALGFFDFLNLAEPKTVGKAHPTRFCPNTEELPIAIDEFKISRSGGQKQLKSLRIFHFRRKSPWLKELEIRKDFEPEKEGRKIGVLAW